MSARYYPMLADPNGLLMVAPGVGLKPVESFIPTMRADYQGTTAPAAEWTRRILLDLESLADLAPNELRNLLMTDPRLHMIYKLGFDRGFEHAKEETSAQS